MMKKSIKLMMGVLLAAILMLTACGSNDDENNAADGNKKEVLVAGTEATFAPFEFLEGGKVVGFDADLLEAIMEEAGYDYEYKHIGWDPIFPSLENDEIQIGVAAITIREDRQETYDFSVPYFESTHMIVFKEGTDIESALDIKGKKIGVQVGTTGQFAAESIVGKNDPSISQYESTGVAFMALENGDIDVVVTDIAVAAEYKKNNPEKELEAITDAENFDAEYYGFMFKKGSKYVEEVNAAFETIFENGKYEEIYKKWFGVEPDLESLKNAANMESMKNIVK